MCFLCPWEERLLVGAPLAQTDQPQVEKGGAVYRCSADSGNACQQIPFDETGQFPCLHVTQVMINRLTTVKRQARPKS